MGDAVRQWQATIEPLKPCRSNLFAIEYEHGGRNIERRNTQRAGAAFLIQAALDFRKPLTDLNPRIRCWRCWGGGEPRLALHNSLTKRIAVIAGRFSPGMKERARAGRLLIGTGQGSAVIERIPWSTTTRSITAPTGRGSGIPARIGYEPSCRPNEV